ncbi:MAG: TlpA disulfide reductase family protein [Alphaproteobacteria bacterium]|jgi:thiol-disulfide isomerase/thioredoxin|nr:TlpA disulfide reductase family protein [Alphaproteobacteria bacterium]
MNRRMISVALAIALALTLFAGAGAAKILTRMDAGLEGLIAGLPVLAGETPGPLRGRVVIVSFFASWCAPCRREFAYLNEIRRAYSTDDVAIVAINWLEYWGDYAGGRRMKRFIAETRPSFPLVEGSPAVSKRFGGVTRMPSLYIFDRRGRNAFRHGNRDDGSAMIVGRDRLIQIIESLR